MTSPSSPEVGAVAAYVDKGQADIGYQIVANKSESDLPKQWSVKLWINNVGNQSEKQEQGGYQQSCGVEDKCKIFPFLGIFFQMTISKGNFQINLGISCWIKLKMNMCNYITVNSKSKKITFS